jgi:hypothetical protein
MRDNTARLPPELKLAVCEQVSLSRNPTLLKVIRTRQLAGREYAEIGRHWLQLTRTVDPEIAQEPLPRRQVLERHRRGTALAYTSHQFTGNQLSGL